MGNPRGGDHTRIPNLHAAARQAAGHELRDSWTGLAGIGANQNLGRAAGLGGVVPEGDTEGKNGGRVERIFPRYAANAVGTEKFLAH